MVECGCGSSARNQFLILRLCASTNEPLLPQIWMCVNEKLEFEDCDQACPGRSCHNANCAHPMLFPPPRPHSED